MFFLNPLLREFIGILHAGFKKRIGYPVRPIIRPIIRHIIRPIIRFIILSMPAISPANHSTRRDFNKHRFPGFRMQALIIECHNPAIQIGWLFEGFLPQVLGLTLTLILPLTLALILILILIPHLALRLLDFIPVVIRRYPITLDLG